MLFRGSLVKSLFSLTTTLLELMNSVLLLPVLLTNVLLIEPFQTNCLLLFFQGISGKYFTEKTKGFEPSVV